MEIFVDWSKIFAFENWKTRLELISSVAFILSVFHHFILFYKQRNCFINGCESSLKSSLLIFLETYSSLLGLNLFFFFLLLFFCCSVEIYASSINFMPRNLNFISHLFSFQINHWKLVKLFHHLLLLSHYHGSVGSYLPKIYLISKASCRYSSLF